MPTASQLSNFAGVWILDKAASDSMAGVASLMCMGMLMRQAVDLVKGMHIQQQGDTLTVAVFSVIEWFKFTEHYRLDGTESLARRRDFRKGFYWANLSAPAPDKLQLCGRWDEPYAGTGMEEVQLAGEDELRVQGTLQLHSGKTCSYRLVYRRRT